MEVPSGTPRIVAMLTPIITNETALPLRPSGARRIASTMTTLKNRPCDAARISRVASSMP